MHRDPDHPTTANFQVLLFEFRKTYDDGVLEPHEIHWSYSRCILAMVFDLDRSQAGQAQFLRGPRTVCNLNLNANTPTVEQHVIVKLVLRGFRDSPLIILDEVQYFIKQTLEVRFPKIYLSKINLTPHISASSRHSTAATGELHISLFFLAHN